MTDELAEATDHDADLRPADAMSIDGREFRFSASLASGFSPGAFVTVLDETGRRQIGQVEDVLVDGEELVGSGRIFGVLQPDGRLDARESFAFVTAELAGADVETVEALYPPSGSTLPIGSFVSVENVSARLLSNRFNRHTFWVGQSGSGKTCALGVLLEQLLLHTKLPMVIFDPNADFVRLREANNADTPSAVSGSASAVSGDTRATVFGFLPSTMLARSPRFRQGEALFAGGFVPAPALVKVGPRLTREGGADVSVPVRP